MPRLSDMMESKYLKQTDVHPPKIFTISSFDKETVGFGDDAEDKWVLYFAEEKKGFVLNKTNIALIQTLYETDEVPVGSQIELYRDPTITHMGKVVGGIRVRKPSQVTKEAQAGVGSDAEKGAGDDIPF